MIRAGRIGRPAMEGGIEFVKILNRHARQLGHDLQFIRINGTVVGAGVGIILHAIALALA